MLMQIDMRLHYGISILIFLCLTSSINASLPNKEAGQFMNLQNKARAGLKVNLRPLVWDQTLAKYARDYAGQRRKDCALEHSNGKYGENIFWGSGVGWTPAQAAADWVAEKQYYNYGSNSCKNGQQCGHYTQIVWKDTNKTGCARVVCNKGMGVFMICSYDPPGNYYGEKPY